MHNALELKLNVFEGNIYNSNKININFTKKEIDKTEKPHEAGLLLLDSSKAKSKLSWQPRWSLETALDKIIEWHQAWKENKIMAEVSISQIQSYNNSRV